jgi:hypothetical protein
MMINGMAAVKLLCLTLFCAVIPAAIAQRSLLQATGDFSFTAILTVLHVNRVAALSDCRSDAARKAFTF